MVVRTHCEESVQLSATLMGDQPVSASATSSPWGRLPGWARQSASGSTETADKRSRTGLYGSGTAVFCAVAKSANRRRRRNAQQRCFIEEISAGSKFQHGKCTPLRK